MAAVTAEEIRIEPGQTLHVPVHYAPTAIGTHTATVTVTTNAGTQEVTLVGNAATIPLIAVEPGWISFGEVDLRESRDLPVTITNIGGGTLTGSLSIPEGARFYTFQDPTFSLAPGQSIDRIISFQPNETKYFLTEIAITSNGGNTKVTVTGTGTYPPPKRRLIK